MSVPETDESFGPVTFPLKENLPPRVGKNKVLVISGPTATGKTAISLDIAKKLGGEIVSADSMQVYRGLDIGTAKATLDERLDFPHHLIDIRDISESFNVVDFYQEANRAIYDILSRGQVPIVVGGTGFYLHALLYGPPTAPPSDPDLRAELEGDYQKYGPDLMYDRLKSYDPLYAGTITPGDRQKIVRALEIIKLSDKRVSDFRVINSATCTHNFDFHCWFLYYPRDILYQRIEMRCDAMIAEGLIEEVKGIDREELKANSSAANAIGYRQCLAYLSSKMTNEDFETFVREFKQASRRYAKRQFTWFRKEPLFEWLDLGEIPPSEAAQKIINEFEISL